MIKNLYDKNLKEEYKQSAAACSGFLIFALIPAGADQVQQPAPIKYEYQFILEQTQKQKQTHTQIQTGSASFMEGGKAEICTHVSRTDIHWWCAILSAPVFLRAETELQKQ